MNVVLSVEPKGEKAALLVMDSGERVWTPDRAKAQDLVGRPIPEAWTQKQGEYGPQAFPPREGKPAGGKPAWANTEEGEKYVQERMDRRTALMQAVLVYQGSGDSLDVLNLAPKLYAWLRDVSPAPAPATSSANSGVCPGDTPLDGGGESIGEAPPSPPIKHTVEEWSSEIEKHFPMPNCPICGKEWGPNTTSTGKRVCVQGHVERFDSNG